MKTKTTHAPPEQRDGDPDEARVLPDGVPVPVPVQEQARPEHPDAQRHREGDGVLGRLKQRVRDHALPVQLERKHVVHEKRQVEHAHRQEEHLQPVRLARRVVRVVLGHPSRDAVHPCFIP